MARSSTPISSSWESAWRRPPRHLKENSVVRLESDGSLKVDESFSVVGLKDVYAIGDIATYPYHGPGGNGKYVRIEHWNVAQNAGRVVAGHIINSSVKPQFFTPVFWSALGAQLRYAGNTMAIVGLTMLCCKGRPTRASGLRTTPAATRSWRWRAWAWTL